MLEPLIDNQLVEIVDDSIRSTAKGHLLLRSNVMVFDRYLPLTQNDQRLLRAI